MGCGERTIGFAGRGNGAGESWSEETLLVGDGDALLILRCAEGELGESPGGAGALYVGRGIAGTEIDF